MLTEVAPMSHHTASFLKLQKARLLRAREEVTEALGEGSKAAMVDKSDGRDLGDLGMKDTEADFNLALSEKNHETLRDIDDALQRIEKGTYGVCELSSELIPSERLEFLPFARCTVKAQRDREKSKRRIRGYGIVFEDTPVPVAEESGPEV